MRESASGRTIRKCAEKFYDEDLGLKIDGHKCTTFDLSEKVENERFIKHANMVTEMIPEDLTIQYIMNKGFTKPFIFRAVNGKPRGLRVPEKGFNVKDVERLVGSTRKVDVMNVSSQDGLQMTMHQWAKYFDSDRREKLLNVISLEISHTELCPMVQPPDVVRELDWVETVWPKYLKDSQTDSSNTMSKMKYPKVQKYCLMSVRGSYTDFHMDFGGTSVWYHLLEGAKVFWVIRPSEENLSKFVKWTLAGRQSDVFFGDLVDRCVRVHLSDGDSFFLPGGWIHSVYTPRKSIVFGGNFLHSYNMIGQLQVTSIEGITKVDPKFMYPFFVELMWFVVERYHKYLKLKCRDKSVQLGGHRAACQEKSVLLTQEVEGLHVLIGRLENSERFQSYIPIQIKNPLSLLTSLKDLLVRTETGVCVSDSLPILLREMNNEKNLYRHCKVVSTKRIFNPTLLSYKKEDVGDEEEKKAKNDPFTKALSQKPRVTKPVKRRKIEGPSNVSSKTSSKVSSKTSSKVSSKTSSKVSTKVHTKKRRCNVCVSCMKDNCRQCKYCVDMKCYGGPNLKRQHCVYRKCLQPIPPGYALVEGRLIKEEEEDEESSRASSYGDDYPLNEDEVEIASFFSKFQPSSSPTPQSSSALEQAKATLQDNSLLSQPYLALTRHPSSV